MPAPELDIVVLGATGVTGRQVVRYLAERVGETTLSWGVAGRDPERLRQVLDECDAGAELIEVNTDRPETVRSMAERCRVVANLVGPYVRHGAVVYAACVAAGTDQIDVCGEVDWLRDRIGELHEAAVESGARIVATAGFEALPFDLLTWYAAERLLATAGEPLADIDVAITVHRDPPITRPADLVSGGTLVSGADAIRRGTHAATGDARLLDPQPHEALAFDLVPRRHSGSGAWIGPLVPSPYINPVVVHRTAALARDRSMALFAPGLRYRDGLVAAGLFPLVPAALGASWLSAAHAAGSALTAAPASVRSMVADMIEAVGPGAGEGPDDARLAGWSWRLDARAQGSGGHVLDVTATGSGHPGYRSTANLVGEGALLLAESPDEGPGGILTPAAAFGTAGPARFERAGLRISDAA